MFGSGASYGPHAQFMEQTALGNKGRKIGLLRGATTRFATLFYAMVRLLRLKELLGATIHQLKFQDLTLNDRDRLAVFDVKDEVFWKAIYTLTRAVFVGLILLRTADSNTLGMDLLEYYKNRTSVAIMRSTKLFDDPTLFRSLKEKESSALTREEDEVFGSVDEERYVNVLS